MTYAYQSVIWEISGVCNAACRYCPSGSKNILGNLHKSQASILSPEDFKDGLHYLISKGVIVPDYTTLSLFNWGEPFLHPRFEEMLEITSSMGFSFDLSTNASVLKMIPVSAVGRLRSLLISVPGWSQASHDRMHGFDFNTICENIKLIAANVQENAPGCNIIVVYHLYKTNQSEIEAAMEFCKKINIKFFTFYPINLFELQLRINDPNWKETSEDLFVEVFDRIKAKQPAAWVCPQIGQLIIDEYNNVVQCCGIDRYSPEFVIGNIKDIDFETLTELRFNAPICSFCNKHGYSFLINNRPPVQILIDNGLLYGYGANIYD